MFFLKTLHKELQLHPKYFGPHLRHVVQRSLIEDVEGTSLGKDGYVITVTHINNIGEGIIEDSGIVNFQISYDAILFLPFRDEVMDATVRHVNQLGFYASVGPLQVFVTRHAMPEDVTTYNMETQTWISDDQEVEIKAGSGVRLRIMNTSVGTEEIRAIGTIKEDYLGLISTE